MTVLMRHIFTTKGEVVHDQTVVLDLLNVTALEKDVWIDDKMGTLRIEFDPPLVVPEGDDE